MEPHLPVEWQEALASLSAAARLWCRRGALDLAVVDAVRHRALAFSHQLYAERIPVYRRLAGDGDLFAAADVATLASELMLTGDVFKSYSPAWLDAGDYARLTDWLGEICIHRPAIDLDGVKDLRTWRARLRREEIYVGCSSGTSGRLSFIPRDRLTWTSLRLNGAWCTPDTFQGRPVAWSDFDCLILGFPGDGTGIQGAGAGMARVAARCHFLFDLEIDADDLLASTSSRTLRDPARAESLAEATGRGAEAAAQRAFAFLRAAIAGGRPVLLFGAPFQLLTAALRALDERSPLHLPAGSLALSGGGWKSFTGERVEREELLDLLRRAFGIAPGHAIDTYSTSEINATLVSCGHGRYHVPPLLEAVVLDDALTPIPGDDALGTLGFLDPFAFSYPGFVITGDEARLVRSPCPCGLAGPSLEGEIRRRPTAEVKGCGGTLASVLSG